MKTKLITGVLLGALLYGMICTSASAADSWPMFRRDQKRTGVADSGVLDTTTPHPIWVYPATQGDIPAIDDITTNVSGIFSATGWSFAPTSDENAAGYYGSGYEYASTSYSAAWSGAPSGTMATWTFDASAVAAGFLVYAWFPSYQDGYGVSHSTDAHYYVQRIRGGVTTTLGKFKVDQTNGGGWVKVGSQSFDLIIGDQLSVVLTTETQNKYSDTDPRIVIADAMEIIQDAGKVYASPAVCPDPNKYVITCITKNQNLDQVDGQDGQRECGMVYAIGRETDSNISSSTDDRGVAAWHFPDNTSLNKLWIGDRISSSPTVVGDKIYVAGGDGTVYLLNADGTSTNTSVLKCPGYFKENPSATDNWVASTESPMYQGTEYLRAPAFTPSDKPSDEGPTSKHSSSITWPDVTVSPATSTAEYSVYAWIPPSTSTESHIDDAHYTVTVKRSGGVTNTFEYWIDQRNGGRWVLLGDAPDTDSSTTDSFVLGSGDAVSVQLQNDTGMIVDDNTLAKLYVVADEIKVVPSYLSGFQFSSPLVDSSNIYIGGVKEYPNQGKDNVGRVFALAAGNPEPVWTYPSATAGVMGAVYASPATDGSSIYVGSADGHVYALNSGGSLLWKYPSDVSKLSLGQISSTTAVGSQIYVGIDSDITSTFNFGTSGRVLAIGTDGSGPDKYGTGVGWFYPAPSKKPVGTFQHSSPLVMTLDGVESVLIGSTDGNLYGVDSSGNAKWTSFPSIGSSSYSSAAGVVVNTLPDNTPMAFIGTEGGQIRGVQLIPPSGTTTWTQWSWNLLGSATSSPAITGKRVYIGDTGGFTWAFSTIADGTDEWNTTLGMPVPPTSSNQAGTNGQTSAPQVDIFSKADYDKIRTAMKKSADDSTAVRTLKPITGSSPADAHTRPTNFEWGENMYFIAWNLMDPNWDYVNGKSVGKDYLTSSDADIFALFKSASPSTITLTLRSTAPGDQSDMSETLTMSDKGFYVDSFNNIVYYAVYIYPLGASSATNPQTPGNNIVVGITEKPSGANFGKNSTGEATIGGAATPAKFTINNPLGLYCGTTPVGVDAGGNTTSSNSSLANVNGNSDGTITTIPTVTLPSDIIHGSSGTTNPIKFINRSMLSVQLSNVKVDSHDLEWSGGIPSTFIPVMEIAPGPLGQNVSPDYPDIRASRVTTPSISSLPVAGTGPGSRSVGFVSVPFNIDVPQFQPAGAAGYLGKYYLYVDSNGDNRFQRPADPSVRQLNPGRVPNVKAEAYREFNIQAGVAMDRHVTIDETVIDIGDVPQGFGWVPGAGGNSIPFYNTLGTTTVNGATVLCPVSATATPSDFGRWFKPFTLHNVGNVNLTDIRIGTTSLSSDTVPQYPMVTPGSSVYGIVTSALGTYAGSVPRLNYVNDPTWGTKTGATYPNKRTFHKARVGDDPTGTTLRLPDSPDYPNSSWPGTPQPPLPPTISVAVPIGQPVGTYVGTIGFVDGGNPITNTVTATLKVNVTEARLTDGNTDGTVPQLDSGPASSPASPASAGDMSPAAYRDPTNGNVYLVFSSSRNLAGTPSPTDPWYLYTTSLSTANPQSSVEWAFAPTNNTWWSAPTRYPGTGKILETDPDTFFPIEPDNVGRTTDANSVKFASPSIAVYNDPNSSANSRAWLWFTGEACKEDGNTALANSGNQNKTVESRIYIQEITNGNMSGPVTAPTPDFRTPKYGVRGAATLMNSTTSPNLWLWTFWYGGGNNKWRIYYNTNLEVGGSGSGHWTNPAELPLPKGITSAAEASPVFRNVLGVDTTKPNNPPITDILEVAYSGYSPFHGNSDIYLGRYKPDSAPKPIRAGGHMPLTMIPFSKIDNETLQRQAGSSVWYSNHLDWDLSKPLSSSVSDPFRIWVCDRNNIGNLAGPTNSAIWIPITIGKTVKDPATGALAFLYSDANDPAQVTLKNLFRGIVVDPASGTVKFMRPPPTMPSTTNTTFPNGAAVIASYVPKAYRVTTSDLADVSPCAVLDTSRNPYWPSGKPFYAPGYSGPIPSTDRLWVFWRRAGDSKSGAGIRYKALRHAVKLSLSAGARLTGVTSVTWGTNPVPTPVEIDKTNGRLYFVSDEEGKNVDVMYTYIDSGGVSQSTSTPESHVVGLCDEFASKDGSSEGISFGSLTKTSVNEGQICAFQDTVDKQKIWAFWTSAREGNTDLYYEVINPKL